MSDGEFGFGNDLEAASRRLSPQLDEALNRLHPVMAGLTMSGTGAALFAPFFRRVDAEAALAEVRKLGYLAWVCRPVSATA
jgi:4-diphosphocytidyl-2C-methyl-D-erythritol kinase